MSHKYGLRKIDPLMLAALVAITLVAFYSRTILYLAQSESTSNASWTVLSGLKLRNDSGFNSIYQQSIERQFEAQMQHAHFTANNESLHTYCSQMNFNQAFVSAAEKRYKDNFNATERIFVAVNLFNSEHILPNMATQLLALAKVLGRSNVFISVYENGSTDNTKRILHAFNHTLAALEIPHQITADSQPRPTLYHRIQYMADIRNCALQPLYTHNIYSRVMFLNDVYFCLSDILELIYQAQHHRTHLLCAEDFDTRHGALEFYDTWVARDMLGRAFRNRYQNIADDSLALVGQISNRPFQVQCCWNGMAIIDAQAFSFPHNLRFRRSNAGECSASECSLLCNDMWRHGMSRILVVPRIKVSYNIATRDRLRQPSTFPRDSPFSDTQSIRFRPSPKTVYCHPLSQAGRNVPDGPASLVPV
ncbi:hypothetical protein IWW42_001181 [Coemansia sp. RSA 1085]|nr:hypothetical protein IWW42_001181 [Coemansia sp. RSA 1085]